MSSAEEYAYTFRMIIPEKSPEELVRLRDELITQSDETSVPMVVSTIDDFMTLSVHETTEFADERLSYAAMLAKTALQDHGVQQPVFIKAFATRMNGAKLLEIHKQVVLETEREYITDLTDELMRTELSQLS